MISKPLVSVIMSVYKEPEEYIRKAIESILNQTFEDFEFLIALDNPENELALQVIKEYAEKDRRIKFYINEKNIGLPRSLNLLISKSSGSYIFRMDADDISLPQRLEVQVDYLKNSDVGILGSWGYKMNEKDENYGVFKMPTTEECIRIYLESGFTPMIHPSIAVRKEVFQITKGYRNFQYAQDYDFLLRAYKLGVKLANISQILISYRVHSHFHKTGTQKSYDQYKFVKLSQRLLKENNFSEVDIDLKPDNILDKFFRILYNFSRHNFIQASDSKSKGKYLSMLSRIPLVLVSPHHTEYFLRLLRVKLMCKLIHKNQEKLNTHD